MSYGTTIIPALPGTYKLDSSERFDCTLDVCKIPVVAWAVEYSQCDDRIYTKAHPVTLEYAAASPRNDLRGLATILHPCGSVEDMSVERFWDTYEDYVASHEAGRKRIKDKNDKN